MNPITSLALITAAKFIIDKSSSESEESSEEEVLAFVTVIRRKYKRKPSRIINYLETTVANYTAKEFQQHFRITIDAYENLLRIIGPRLQRKVSRGRHTINIEKQVLSVLWLLATPDSYRSVADRFDMGKSSLSVSFMRVVKILCSLGPYIIKWPTGERLQNIKEKFRRIAGLQNVIGAVDGTFIDIKAPHEDPESYITRKCSYSVTLQAIADPCLKFTDVFAGFPGSVSDNRIFRNSDFYIAVRNNLQNYFPEQEFIIGDKAYPLLSWCIPPYINRGNMTPAKTYFNSIIAKTRQVIERSFALLFGRLRRLKFLDMNRYDYIPSTILAACVIHNICLDHTDLEVENYIREGLNHLYHNENEENGFQDEREGRDKRDEICRLLWAERN